MAYREAKPSPLTLPSPAGGEGASVLKGRDYGNPKAQLPLPSGERVG